MFVDVGQKVIFNRSVDVLLGFITDLKSKLSSEFLDTKNMKS